METVLILGHEFPRHPSARACGQSAAGRLRAAVRGLEFARASMTPPERAAYLAIVKAEAMVRQLLRTAESASSIESTEPDWLNFEGGPSSSRIGLRGGSGS